MFSVVRLCKVIFFEKDRAGRGLGEASSTATTFNVLHSDEWEMQKGGNSLLIKKRGTDFQYEIPWHHVDSALHEPEVKTAAKPGKAG